MRDSYVAFRPALLLALAFSAACSSSGRPDRSSAPPADNSRASNSTQAVPVSIGHVTQRAVPLELQLIGTVEPSSTVQIRSQVTGELTEVTFREGEDVREGQRLFSLDPRPLEAALKQAEAALQRDTAQAANARAQATRVRELAERGIATREQAETAATGVSALEATLTADRASVENARVQLQYATITAPITGRTGALQVHPGNLVRANDTTPLVVINQVSPVNVSFAVPEAQLSLLKGFLAKGSVKVQAEAPSDEEGPSEGRIAFVDNAVDATTGTIRVKGSFANADRRLWPGQFVNVVMTLSTDPNALVVPSIAVQTGPQGPYVYVVKGDRTVDQRPVQTGRIVGDDTIITKGLSTGDTVVTDGQLRLLPGTHIAIKDAVAERAGA